MLLFQNKNIELYENHLVSTETITMVKQQLGTSGCCFKSPRTEMLVGSSPGTKASLLRRMVSPKHEESCLSAVKMSLPFFCVFIEFWEPGCLQLVWCRRLGDWQCKGTPETPGIKKNPADLSSFRWPMSIRKGFSAGLRGGWHLVNRRDTQTPGSVQPQAFSKEKSQSFFSRCFERCCRWLCDVAWEWLQLCWGDHKF